MIKKLDTLYLLIPRIETHLISLLNKIITQDIYFESCFKNQKIFPVNFNSKIRIKISKILKCVEGIEFNPDSFFICLKFPKSKTFRNAEDSKDYNFKYFKWKNIDQMFSLKFDQVGYYFIYLLLIDPEKHNLNFEFMKNEIFKCSGFYPLYNWVFVSNEMIEKYDFYCTHNVKVDPYIKHLKQKFKYNFKGKIKNNTNPKT